MSSEQDQAAVQAASDAVTIEYIIIASLALFVYDSLLTLSEEVPHIWKKKWKIGTALYVLARYGTILFIVTETIYLVGNFTSLQFIRTCNAMAHLQNAIFILPFVGIQGLLLARAYAVTDHKRLVLAVLGILSICAIVPELAAGVLINCDLTNAQRHTFAIVNAISTIATILFDTTVVVVTLAGTQGTWRVYKRSAWNGLTLTHIIAVQSLMRFGFVLTITVANGILPPVLRPTLYGVVGFIQNSLSAIIICRFHLNLQKNAHPNSNASQGLPTLSFGSFQAASQSMHDAVVAEFGGSLVNDSFEAEMAGDEIELEEFQSQPQSAERMPGPSGSALTL